MFHFIMISQFHTKKHVKKMVLVQQPALAVVLILDLWSLCALSVLKK